MRKYGYTYETLGEALDSLRLVENIDRRLKG